MQTGFLPVCHIPAPKAGGEGSTREIVDVTPGWLASEPYDIIAKSPAPAPNEQLRLMLPSSWPPGSS